jgi:hypothetical protein
VCCGIGGDAESSATATREWLIIKKYMKEVSFVNGRWV